MAFQYIGLGGSRAHAIDPAEVHVRQLNTLVSGLDQASTASPASFGAISSIVLAIRSTRILYLLTRHTDAGSEAAAQALRKAALKAVALVTAHPSRSAHLVAGFSLALELSEQSGWSAEEGIQRHGQGWLGAAFTYLSITSGQAPPSASTGGHQIKADAAVLGPLLGLLTKHILSPAAASQPEFARAVVTPNLPRFAGMLTASIEDIKKRSSSCMTREDEASMICLLSTLAAQLQVHPNIFRPFVARLHEAAMPLMVSTQSSPALVLAASDLIGHLYLTGSQSIASGKPAAGSKSTQAQLWSATVQAAIRSTSHAWEVAVSTIDRGTADSSSDRGGLPFESLPQDPFEAHIEVCQRLERLLGTSKSEDCGILLRLLQFPTARAVPMPLTALTSLARSMLSVTTESPCKLAIDSSLHATQLTVVPQFHLQALRVLHVTARMSQGAGVAAMAHLGPHWLQLVIRPLERGIQTPAPVRASASRLLALLVSDSTLPALIDSSTLPGFKAGCAMPLDPAARTVLRGAKVCLSEVARLFSSDGDQAPNEPSSQTAHGGQSGSHPRKKKRSRMYESDALFSGSALEILGLKQLDERASALACLYALPSFFSHLCTSLTPVHYDLAHTSVQLVTTLAEITLRQPAPSDGSLESAHAWVNLAAATLVSLARMIRVASGPILGLLAPRLTDLATFALGVVGPTQPSIACASHEALAALREVSLPNLPPVLAAKMLEGENVAEEELAVASRDWGTDPSTGAQMVSKTGHFVQMVGGEVKSTADTVKVALGIDLMPRRPKRRSSADKQDESGDENEEEELRTAAPLPSQGTSRTFQGPQPSSPSRPAEDTITDPVKPRQRPSTPRIGSPNRAASSSSHFTPSGGTGGSPEARDVFGGAVSGAGGSNARRTVSSPSPQGSSPAGLALPHLETLTPQATSTAAVEVGQKDGDGNVSITTIEETTAPAEKPVNGLEMRIESDDEEMPEIDINSSDED